MSPRCDLYRNIHKGLRAAMFDTACRFGRLNTEEPEALQQALDQAQRLLMLMASHVKHENDFVHCAIEARRPGGAQRTADEHREHLETLHALGLEVAALRRALPAERGPLAQRLYRHFVDLAADQLQHMQREETHNNELLWTLYSDIELQALHDRLLAAVEPAARMEALRWMAQALNPQELAELMGDLQRKAPPEAFGAALSQVRAQLDEPRWQRLAHALRLS